MVSNNSESILMLVEDPDDTLATLCIFGDDDVNKTIFTIEYEKIKGRFKPIHIKHADTHFYTLTTFKFLVPSGMRRGIYHQSLTSKELCTLRNDPNMKGEYQKRIANILLNNERKGKLFRDFLDFVKEKKTRNEIYKNFKEITSRTLIAWSKYAGLIIEIEDHIQSLPGKKIEISQEEFETNLIEIYDQLQDPHDIGVKRIAVPIGEIRFNLCVKLGLTEFEFDQMLRILLDKDHNHIVKLHGATSDAFEKEPTFEYLNKLYIYLSMKEL
jgi:hypothetical protein